MSDMIFSFANQKGGVGKTTTVLNLGAFIARKGKKVLLVDIDPQANLTSGLGHTTAYMEETPKVKDKIKSQVNSTTYDLLLGSGKVSEIYVATKVKNLFLIPSSLDLAGAEIELVNKISREFILKDSLNEIKNQFDYIFIDCPPSLGLLTVNALVAANKIVIPIQCEYFALEGLSQLSKTIEMIRSNLNRTLKVGGVILTMFDSRTKLSKEIEFEVRKFFGAKVFKTVVPRNVKLSEAPSHGEPIVLYDKKAPGSTAYRKIANEFIRRLG